MIVCFFPCRMLTLMVAENARNRERGRKHAVSNQLNSIIPNQLVHFPNPQILEVLQTPAIQ